MAGAQKLLRALLPFALLALSRGLDRSLGMLLHTGLELTGVFSLVARLLDLGVLRETLIFLGAGALLWLFLAWERGRRAGLSIPLALAEEASTFDLLYLFPLVTLLALLSTSLHAGFPFAFTLPVALTQDLRPVLEVLVFVGLLVLRAPALRPPAPRPGEIFFVSFLVYALLAPEWTSKWEGHPGNEPKYLRMAVALSARLSFDVEPESSVSDQASVLEVVEPEAFSSAAPRALSSLLRETRLMLEALPRGSSAWGRSAIRATRIARQTIQGKEGGTYHVLAPGPSLLLAPLLGLDRALDRRLGTPGGVALSVLAWNLFGAALVTSLFLLIRDLTRRPGLSAAVAALAGLTPPFLFYFYQFYPEPLGALFLVLLLRPLLSRQAWRGSLWAMGGLLSFLPWLHQKFLPVFIVLLLLALVRAVGEMVRLRDLLALLLPSALSLFLFALYNFGITGSIRPDALFLAWGPGGVNSARVGEGLLGLLLDLRYGLLPSAPIYLLVPAGFFLAGRRLLPAVLPLAVYYATVAAADNWSGAVCDLGRYVLPIAPMFVVGIAVAMGRVSSRRGLTALSLVLAFWTLILAKLLWDDPVAATDSARLFDKSTYADPNLYFPSLFFRSWNYGAPGTLARVLALGALGVLLAFWFSHPAAGRSVRRSLVGSFVVLLAVAFFLETWPSSLPSPRFQDAVRLDRGATAYLTGPLTFDHGRVRARRGVVSGLVSAASPLSEVAAFASGSGRLAPGGELPKEGLRLELPLEPLLTVTGRGGHTEQLSRFSLEVESPGEVVLELHASRPSSLFPSK